jgi:hypothetical protein
MFFATPVLRSISVFVSRVKGGPVVRRRFSIVVAHLSLAITLAAILGLVASGCSTRAAGSNAPPPVLHSVTLTWTASVSPVIGYRVYRASQSGGPYSLAFPPILGTSFVDTNVQPGQTYFYVVTSIGLQDNESVFSKEVSATIPKP